MYSYVDRWNEYFTTNVSKAELLNTSFLEQSTLDLRLQPILPDFEPKLDLKTQRCIDSVPVDPQTVHSILKSLDTSKATGPYGFGNTVLKHCASALYIPISIISEISLNSGSFPNIWKQANVVPVFKKGDNNCKSNYRPISLLSNLSKFLEWLVYNISL